MAVSERFFECKLSISLSPYFQGLISGLNIALSQLSLNTWRTLVGYYVLWKEARFPPMSWTKLNLAYCIKKCPKTGRRPNKGFFYLSTYANSKIPMFDKSSSNKHWQEKFFFLSGAWKNEQGPAVRRNFAWVSHSLHKSKLHSEEDVRRLRTIVRSLFQAQNGGCHIDL